MHDDETFHEAGDRRRELRHYIAAFFRDIIEQRWRVGFARRLLPCAPQVLSAQR